MSAKVEASHMFKSQISSYQQISSQVSHKPSKSVVYLKQVKSSPAKDQVKSQYQITEISIVYISHNLLIYFSPRNDEHFSYTIEIIINNNLL